MAPIIPVSTLTRGERLYLARVRSGLTQHEAAHKHGVHVERYRAWERDQRDDGPLLNLPRLRLPEACRLRRRQAGLTQKQLAAILGVSKLWVVRMENEHAPITLLASHWGLR